MRKLVFTLFIILFSCKPDIQAQTQPVNYLDTFVIKMTELSKAKTRSFLLRESIDNNYTIIDLSKFIGIDKFPFKYGTSNLDVRTSNILSKQGNNTELVIKVNNYILKKWWENNSLDAEIVIKGENVFVDNELVIIKKVELNKSWMTYRIVDGVNVKLRSTVRYIDKGHIISVQDIIDDKDNILVKNYSQIIFIEGYGIVTYDYSYLEPGRNRLYSEGQVIKNPDEYVHKKLTSYIGQGTVD